MDLSIIIPSYNTKSLLDRCLSSVYSSLSLQDISYEIIVVDNASRDGTKDILNTKYPQVKKILNKTNLGYSKANNQGIKKSSGRYILLLNSDIAVTHKSIQFFYSFIKNKKRTFAGGKLFNEDRSHQSSCGPFFTLPVVFTALFLKGDRLGITRYSPKVIKTVDWISGACIIGEKHAFFDVGLFDENVFMYMDEVEFFYRAKKKGYTVLFYPDAQFIHTGAASSRSKATPVINIYKGLIYHYHKHRSIIEQRILKIILKTKAYCAITVGKIFKQSDMVSIYEKALKLC